ncbi:hypothetical protein HY310_01590 [Candidatus Microgenomates bacterium]|nr:hypothetical protein [Candidatus Microgenomates bacterium]
MNIRNVAIIAHVDHGKTTLVDALLRQSLTKLNKEQSAQTIPSPTGDPDQPLQILVTTIKGDNFKGRIATGRVHNGRVKAGQEITQINRAGEQNKYRITSLITFEGLERKEILEAQAGDIVAIAGIPDINIGETITDPVTPIALPLLDVELPTVKMTFGVNTSPFAGREGKFSTSRQIRERLMKELETDMALRVADNPDGTYQVSGRGELHLAILIERLRREGYEFEVSRPKVIEREGQVPFETVYIEAPEEFSGIIMQEMGERHGNLRDMRQENGVVFLEFFVPTRGLLGYRSKFITDTRGLGIINTSFEDYGKDFENWKERNQGSLVAHETGKTLLYGMTAVQDRGELFLGPGVEVYKGQVVGQNSRAGDLVINVCKEKKLSNMRSKGDGAMEHFNVPKAMNLEAALEYIDDTELVEVTPQNIRIRKIILDENQAKRITRGLV